MSVELNLYPKFFIELKKKENIDKETFCNSNFGPIDYYQSDVKGCYECICGVAIEKMYVISSNVLNLQLIIGRCCYVNFLKDQKILKNEFVKACLLCNNVTIGNNHQICDDCQAREKCIKCKSHTPYINYEVCIFCEFNQKPLNDGKQILGRYGDIPIYIKYGEYGPYLRWLDKKINIAKWYIKDNKITIEDGIKSIQYYQNKNKTS